MIVLAVGDNHPDAELWKPLIPERYYVSRADYGDPADQVPSILVGTLAPAPPVSTRNERGPLKRNGGSDLVAMKSSKPQSKNWAKFSLALVCISLGVCILLIARNWESLRPKYEAWAMRRRAVLLARRKKQERAEALIDKVLERADKKVVSNRQFANREFSLTYDVALNRIFGGDLEKQQAFICKQLDEEVPRERAEGLAPIVLDRWFDANELLISEFFMFSVMPHGDAFMNGLRSFIPNNWSQERTRFAESVTKLASATVRLKEVAGESA